MDNKYYVPGISEFHVGFEFEVYSSFNKFFFGETEGWKRASMNFGVLGNIANIQKLILDNQIRVKHLDHDDIVECGFELAHEEKGNPNKMYYFGQHSLIWNGKCHCVVTKYCKDRQKDFTCFVGTIKNKSELKLIMQMVGIK